MDEEGFYIVSCPFFKGCHSYGKTIEEGMNNIREVLEMCIEEESSQEHHFVEFRELAFHA